METLEEIFHPNGFIEKSAVWPAGAEPVRRIIFACVPTNCDDAAGRTQGDLGFDPVIRHIFNYVTPNKLHMNIFFG